MNSPENEGLEIKANTPTKRRTRRRIDKKQEVPEKTEETPEIRKKEEIGPIEDLPEIMKQPVEQPRKKDSEFSEDDDKEAPYEPEKIQNNEKQEEEAIKQEVFPLKENSETIDTSVEGFSSKNIIGNFFISRESRVSHIRSPRIYKFINDDKTFMTIKEHGLIAPDIYLNEGSAVHIKTLEYTHKITCNARKSNFEVYSDAERVCTIDFDNDYGEYIGPRKIEIKYGDTILRSKIPKRGENGLWRLPFGGHFTIPSCRNAIILDENNNEAILIRKIGANILELSVKIPIPMYVVASFAITSYLYKE